MLSKNIISKLKAKEEIIMIEGLGEVKVKGLSLPELAEFAKYAEAKDYQRSLDYMVYVTLRKNFPQASEDAENGMSDEELKTLVSDMDGGIAAKLIGAVQKVSGLGDAAKNPQP